MSTYKSRPVLWIVLGILLAAPVLCEGRLGDDTKRIAGKMAPSDKDVINIMDGNVPTTDASLNEILKGIGDTHATSTLRGELSRIRSPLDLLRKDNTYLDRLIGKKAAFTYDPYRPRELDDPMVIPWTRARVLTKELDKLAADAFKAKNWLRAYQTYVDIIQLINGLEDSNVMSLALQDARKKARDGIEKVREAALAEQIERVTIGLEKPKEIKLPPWVEQNTIGILYHPPEPLCLVGTHYLRVGDEVPNQHVTVKVVRITRDTVHFQVEDHPKPFLVKIAAKEID